ncbi:DM13 domain-containing protein [Aquimarina agarivorans]|uniref:DM13 domain-containing protein n=1 Tax=Aquimarina agarivorans TaxID=980584 RepID=UPI000248F637|nr:DM13 domain-containing protein [Aquimarina agarivorans]
MKLKSIIYGMTPILLASCIGEDIEVVPDPIITSESVSFDRKLTSIAVDETFKLDVKVNGRILNADNEQFDLDFSSNDETIATIDEIGNVTPQEGSVGKKVTLSATLTPITTDSESEPIVETDEITIGLVTISENEASLFTDTNNNGTTDDEVADIISNGYDPKITINENISEIDINQENDISLSAIFQNRKNEIENIEFVWSSDNENILTINSEGVINAVSKGTTTVKVSAEFEGETISSKEKTITVSEETVIITPDPVEEPVETKTIIGSGSLISNSSYTVNGSFEIFTENGKNFISLSDDFSARGLPDLVLYLSNSPTSNAGAPIVASPETNNDRPVALTGSGAQTFEIPASINPEEFQNVLLFCRRFTQKVGFGVINR